MTDAERPVSHRLTLALLALTLLVAARPPAVHAQQPPVHLGGPPAQIPGKYWTEESWIVHEIVLDITEMSAYAVKPSAKPIEITVETVRPGLYRLSGLALHGVLPLDLNKDIWDPASFLPIAHAALGKDGARQNVSEHTEVYPALTDLTPFQLTRTSAEISRDLAVNMRNAPLHDAAALTIGGFALRESAGRFNDVRGSLNRMTAHLAMARALAGGREPGIDGKLAEAIRLTLSGHQASAMRLLDQLDAGANAGAVRPWTRALRLRITQDWRQLPDPASASLVEKFEYLRARRATNSGVRSTIWAEKLHVDPRSAADWSRIVQLNPMGLEEGQFVLVVSPALEVAEIEQTYPASRRDAKEFSVADWNARAGRCITEGKPQVLSWGAWAEFSQRHVAMLIGTIDHHLRSMEALYAPADAVNDYLDQLHDFTMFPVAAVFRMKGDGKEADTSRLNDAIGVAVDAPERITPTVWSWLERAGPYELIHQGMPKKADWFYPPSARMPYEAAARASALGLVMYWSDHAPLAEESPYDFDLAARRVRAQFGARPTLAHLKEAFGARMDYDVRAIDEVLRYALSDAERLPLLERGCELSAADCVVLGNKLAALNMPKEAAARYEQAFADPSYDELSFSNRADWLVKYYFNEGQTDRATTLANRAANEYSSNGLALAGWLYEHLEEFDKAEKLYKSNAARYPSSVSVLLGFYYRVVIQQKQLKYDEAWKATLATVFPDGLQPATTAMVSQPARGVIVNSDNRDIIKAGFQAGDIIIGLRGYTVDNLAQYRAISKFTDEEKIDLVLWRGSVFHASIAPGALTGVELRTYPISGFEHP
jgi:hypothetical protein